MKPSGYSGTPLAQKLGIKPGFRIKLVHQPDYYFSLFTDWPQGVMQVNSRQAKKNLVHYFTKSATELEGDTAALAAEIEPDGAIWISWPKKTSKVITDVTENKIRELLYKTTWWILKFAPLMQYGRCLNWLFLLKTAVNSS